MSSRELSFVHWALCQLEQFPAAIFHERDLRRRFGGDIAQAIRTGILRRLPRLAVGDRYFSPSGRVLTVVAAPDGLEAVDDEDPECEPLRLDPKGLTRYRLDVRAAAQRLRKANRLLGEPEVLGERFVFIGEIVRGKLSVALVLALLSTGGSALENVRALPSLLPGRYQRIFLVCPSFQPSLSEEREFGALGIFCLQMPQEEPFIVEYSSALSETPMPSPRVVLSHKEQGESERWQFKSRVPIVLTGLREGRKGNRVEAAGHPVVLSDSPFRIFLRLVLGLFETRDGWLSMPEVRSAWVSQEVTESGELLGYELDQALSRLRTSFRPSLGDLEATNFIQRQRGNVRLSTHRRFVTARRDLLIEHPDAGIQEMARRLPKTR